MRLVGYSVSIISYPMRAHGIIVNYTKIIQFNNNSTAVLAARNNLKVKNARQPVKRKDVKMFRSGTQEHLVR